MLLKQREKAWTLDLWCTATSVAGGWLGYAIGSVLYESLGQRILRAYGMTETFGYFKQQFHVYGLWIVATKGLTPLPYKVVTISCGLTGMNIWLFTLASLVARGFRFFLLAALLLRYGPSIQSLIDKNLRLTTFLLIASLIVGFYLLHFV